MVMDCGQHVGGAGVVDAPFDPDGTLGHGGKHLCHVNAAPGHVGKAKPVQTRHRQKRSVRHPVIQLFHPGLHVAAKFHQLQIRAAMRQLRPPAQGRRSHNGGLRQINKRGKARRHEGIPHVLTREIGVKDQPVGLQGGHVLHRMDGNIDLPRQKRLFDFTGEQTLAANVFQGAVQNLIAQNLDDGDVKRLFRQIKGRHEPVAGFVSLSKGKGRSARADVQGMFGCGKRICHAHIANGVSGC